MTFDQPVSFTGTLYSIIYELDRTTLGKPNRYGLKLKFIHLI